MSGLRSKTIRIGKTKRLQRAATRGRGAPESAATQLAQTTLRSAVGKIELDKTFEERDFINIAESEGDRQAKINRADGDRQEAIARSEGEKQKRINEAEGRAFEIERVAQATSEGIRKVAVALSDKGGLQAVNLRIAEQYLNEFGKLAKTNNTMIIPSDLANIAGIVKAASSVLNEPKPA